MTIILIWIYGFALVSPTTFGLYGTFGWDPTLGKCDFCLHSSDGKCDLIEASETMIHPRKIFLTIAFIVPLIMIVMSYFTIWRTAIKSSSSLKLNSILETRKQLQSRDMKMTWTLFGMCFCYIVFVAPIVLCTLLEVQGEGWRGNVNLVCFIVYWLQYTTNFVIYAARSEQYRKAYIQYIKTTVPWLFEWKGSSKRRPRIFIINSGLRRTRSSPTLTVSKDKSSIKLDVKVEYSLDLRFESILHSYNVTKSSPKIIILPGNLNPCQNRKTRFYEVEEDEFSSEGQVETSGIDKEFRSEYLPSFQIQYTNQRRNSF